MVFIMDIENKLEIPRSWFNFVCNLILSFCSMDTECDDDAYRMDYPKRGVFVLINNRYFHKDTGMSERSGTDEDAANLYRLFKDFGFDVRFQQNISTTDMLKTLDKGKCALFVHMIHVLRHGQS